jgi:hypothetical protein
VNRRADIPAVCFRTRRRLRFQAPQSRLLNRLKDRFGITQATNRLTEVSLKG